MSPTLVSVICVHRHGDRSPAVNLFLASPHEHVERDFWESRLPEPNCDLERRFPTPNEDVIGPPFDDDNRPFALLSKLGHAQLEQLGLRLRQRYHQLVSSPRDLYVRSTNYRRTIQSAQACLSSLLAPDFPSVPIHVGGEGDVLNSWKYQPGILTAARKLRKSHAIKLAEERVAHCKARLLQAFPLFGAFPERFTWVTVSDYFVSRECHPDAHRLSGVAQFRDEAVNMMATQFLTFYADSRLRNMVTGPLINGIRQFLAHKSGLVPPPLPVHAVEFDLRANLVLISGHDQTLLPLMCLLGLIGAPDYSSAWPKYASALCFELYQFLDESFRVRIVFDDGQGALSVLRPHGCSSEGFVAIEVFSNLVDEAQQQEAAKL